MFVFADPVKNPVNDWLKVNGVWVAVGVATALLIIVGVLFILSRTKNTS